MTDALALCFGVPPDAPAHVVIGVDPDAPVDEVVARATERLRVIHAKFTEHDPAYLAARARLQAAARTLGGRSRSEGARDELLDIIASTGGWNRKARARAIQWAAARGIDPAALLDLLTTPGAATVAGAPNEATEVRREGEHHWVPWVVGVASGVLALAATTVLTLALLGRNDQPAESEPAPTQPSHGPSVGTDQTPAPPGIPAASIPVVAPPETPDSIGTPSASDVRAATVPRAAAPTASSDWTNALTRLEGSQGSAASGTDAELALLERLEALTEAVLLLTLDRTADARVILDGMPERFTPPEPAVQRRRAVADGGLAGAIDRADGPEARVLALNRWLGASTEIGPSDARTLALLACGPQDGLSRRARAVAMTRFHDAPDMAVGYLDALAVAEPSAATQVIGEWLGMAGADAAVADGAIRLRQALLDRAMALSQGESDSIRQRVAACQASWQRMAPLLGVAAPRSIDGDLGSACLESIVRGSSGTAAALETATLRLRAADTEVERFLAWQAALLDALALPTAGQSRSERALALDALRAAAAERRDATSGVAQAVVNQRAIVRAIAVKAGRWSW